MNKAPIELLTTEEISQTLQTTQLEQVYERALRECERIYEEERSRVLRVQVLLLEDENDDLQEQLVETDLRLEKLEGGHEEIQEQLVVTEADLQRAQGNLKSRLRDIEHYKAELNASNTISADSAKLLTEKLTLARELANLKPEVEHLRSQTASQQSVIAEKLSLQRELSSLQVELETEKRAVQRNKTKDTKSAEDDSKLASQIEELKKEVAKEKRETQKVDRDAKKQAAEWEGQKTILESKVDAFRTKLRSTKDQLKEAQKEVEEAQTGNATRQAEFAAARPSVTNPRKRPVARFDPDMTIGTPGNGGNVAKKARISTLPGDKSTFSITPFLNRTMSIAPESPDEEQKRPANIEQSRSGEEGVEKESITDSPKLNKPKAIKKSTSTTTTQGKESRIFKETTEPNVNTIMPKPRTASSKPALAKVTEVENEENEEASENPSELPNIRKKQAVKKKQKILGQRKSLFDDDDTEEASSRSIGGGLLGAGKGSGLRGGGRRGIISLSSNGKSLAEFSPLKKDRRAVAEASG